MTDAAVAVTETPGAEVDTGDMSPSQLVAFIAKTKPAKAAEPAPVAAEEAKASPVADALDKPAENKAEPEAKPADTAPKRSALDIAKAAAAESVRWRKERAQSQQQQATLVQQLSAEKARAEALAKQLEGVDGDELAWLEKRGVPADKIAQRAIEVGTPEYIAERQQKSIMDRIEAAEARAEAAEKAARDYEERRTSAARDAGEQKARADFLAQSSDAEKYPTLSRLAAHKPQWLIDEALTVHKSYFDRV